MSSEVDDTSVRLAQRIRLERENRNWSLADLADRSGVARATISKIERLEASPTAVSLVRLAAAFGLTLARLLARAEETEELLVRGAAQPVWRDPATGYVRRQVFARATHPVELVEVTLPPRQSVTMPASSFALIRQAVWVRDGRLQLSEGEVAHDLAAGDCIGFGPPADVTYSNQTDLPVTYIVAIARS